MVDWKGSTNPTIKERTEIVYRFNSVVNVLDLEHVVRMYEHLEELSLVLRLAGDDANADPHHFEIMAEICGSRIMLAAYARGLTDHISPPL